MNNALEAFKLHADFPIHSPFTTVVVVAALHAPSVKLPPQLPTGVPQDAKDTADTVWPAGHTSVTTPPAAAVPHETPVEGGGLNVPAAHAVHAVLPPASDAYIPPAQLTHGAAPGEQATTVAVDVSAPIANEYSGRPVGSRSTTSARPRWEQQAWRGVRDTATTSCGLARVTCNHGAMSPAPE